MQTLQADDLESYVITRSVFRRLMVAAAFCCAIAFCVVVLSTIALFLTSIVVGHPVDSWLLSSSSSADSVVSTGGAARSLFGAAGVALGAIASAGLRVVLARRRALLAMLRRDG
jgi:hypothetical protein